MLKGCLRCLGLGAGRMLKWGPRFPPVIAALGGDDHPIPPSLPHFLFFYLGGREGCQHLEILHSSPRAKGKPQAFAQASSHTTLLSLASIYLKYKSPPFTSFCCFLSCFHGGLEEAIDWGQEQHLLFLVECLTLGSSWLSVRWPHWWRWWPQQIKECQSQSTELCMPGIVLRSLMITFDPHSNPLP